MSDVEKQAVLRSRLSCGCSVLVLVLGFLTTCAGVPLSFSVGILSLAAAIHLSRPLALAIASLHLASIVPALIARRTEVRHARRLAHIALAIALFGLALALLAAAFLPGIYEELTSAAVDGIDLH